MSYIIRVHEKSDCCKQIAACAPNTPFYYYHIPVLSGADFQMIDFLERAAKEIPNFVGIKYSQANLPDFKKCIDFIGGDYNILFGVDEMLVDSLPLGATGWVGSTYNHLAPLYYEIIASFKAGEIEEAKELQKKAVLFVETLDGMCGFNGAGKSFMKFSSNLAYKNFGLYIQTDFATGHMAYNHIRGKGLAQTQGNLNQDELVLQSWTPDNRNTDIPRFVFVDAQRNIFRGNEGTINSRFWEKADYLALREVTLSYNFPAATFNDRIQGLNVYLTGSNLHYFKSYSGDTPERGGFQAGEFPVPRVYTAGLSLTF